MPMPSSRLSCANKPRISDWVMVSSALVASSAMSREGRWSTAMAMMTRWAWPTLSCPGRRRRKSLSWERVTLVSAVLVAAAHSAHATGTREECAAATRTALTSLTPSHDSDFLRRRPGQLSVGQAQRVIIAMAVLHHPSLLIADEATSALDTITQSEILGLFAQLNRELGMGILYISHDLLSVAALCHRIAILDAGEIVECGPPSQIFGAPQHAYTQKLVAALPRLPVFTSPTSPTFARHAEPVLGRI